MKVVTLLFEELKGSYRTVYVDQSYTSIDLMSALDNMSLYLTGTLMKNCLPKELPVDVSKSISVFNFKRN